MTTKALITTAELAAHRGVTPQAITVAVRRGKLEPLFKHPGNGQYLFSPELLCESDPEGRVA